MINMKAIILNSGVGSRLKKYTSEVPKSMVQISEDETIFSKAVTTLLNFNIDEFIITTGYLNDVLKEYVLEKFPNTKFKFVHNPQYDSTNYIKSLDEVELYDTGVELTTDDRTLTLQTCIGGSNTQYEILVFKETEVEYFEG